MVNFTSFVFIFFAFVEVLTPIKAIFYDYEDDDKISIPVIEALISKVLGGQKLGDNCNGVNLNLTFREFEIRIREEHLKRDLETLKERQRELKADKMRLEDKKNSLEEREKLLDKKEVELNNRANMLQMLEDDLDKREEALEDSENDKIQAEINKLRKNGGERKTKAVLGSFGTDLDNADPNTTVQSY